MLVGDTSESSPHLILLTAHEWPRSFQAILNPLARPILTSTISVPQFGLDLIGALSACVTRLGLSMESNRLICAFVLPHQKRCAVSNFQLLVYDGSPPPFLLTSFPGSWVCQYW